jgi:hypothetical protein
VGGGGGGLNAATSINLYTAANNTTVTGTPRLSIDSTGKVGIGTSSPSQSLHVQGGSLLIDNGSSAGTIYLHDTTNYINLSSDAMQFATNGAERMRIDSSGKMLIGATSSVGGRLVVDGNSANNIWLIGRDSDGTSSVSFRNNADDAYNARIEAQSSNLMFETNSSERMRIDSSGKVGIGTSSPANNLHVMGSMTLQGSTGTDNAWTFYKNTDQTYLVGLRGSSNDALSFYDLTADVERMRIDTSGAVTMPYQPNFLARLPNTTTSLTVNAWTIFSFNTTEWDRGTNFTNSTHRFTAPVAGIYFFHWLIQIEAITTAPTWYYAYPLVNGSQTVGGTKGTTAADQVEPTGYYHGIKGTQSLQLAANDYVELKYFWSGGNGVVKGGSESMFAGHLIG